MVKSTSFRSLLLVVCAALLLAGVSSCNSCSNKKTAEETTECADCTKACCDSAATKSCCDSTEAKSCADCEKDGTEDCCKAQADSCADCK